MSAKCQSLRTMLYKHAYLLERVVAHIHSSRDNKTVYIVHDMTLTKKQTLKGNIRHQTSSVYTKCLESDS